MAAECAARKKAQTCKVAKGEVKKLRTRMGSEEAGNDHIIPSSMVLWLMENDFL
jgi:hypothetical protein